MIDKVYTNKNIHFKRLKHLTGDKYLKNKSIKCICLTDHVKKEHSGYLRFNNTYHICKMHRLHQRQAVSIPNQLH